MYNHFESKTAGMRNCSVNGAMKTDWTSEKIYSVSHSFPHTKFYLFQTGRVKNQAVQYGLMEQNREPRNTVHTPTVN